MLFLLFIVKLLHYFPSIKMQFRLILHQVLRHIKKESANVQICLKYHSTEAKASHVELQDPLNTFLYFVNIKCDRFVRYETITI